MKIKVLVSLVALAFGLVLFSGCRPGTPSAKEPTTAEYRERMNTYIVILEVRDFVLSQRATLMMSALRETKKPWYPNELKEAWDIACRALPNEKLIEASRSLHEILDKVGPAPKELQDVGEYLNQFVRHFDRSAALQMSDNPPAGFPEFLDDDYAAARLSLKAIRLRLGILDVKPKTESVPDKKT